MQHQTSQTKTRFSLTPPIKISSLQSGSDEVLLAIVTLGLVATIVDGKAEYREIDSFAREVKKRFAISTLHSSKLISAAIARITRANQTNVIDCSCDTINEHLDSFQKMRLLDGLTEIIVSDRIIHENEEYFLDYIGRKLKLAEYLERTYLII